MVLEDVDVRRDRDGARADPLRACDGIPVAPGQLRFLVHGFLLHSLDGDGTRFRRVTLAHADRQATVAVACVDLVGVGRLRKFGDALE